MPGKRSVLFAGACVMLALAVLSISGTVNQLQAANLLTPNVVALAPSELRLTDEQGRTYLRFTTTSWNNGLGPLELFVRPDEAPSNGQQNVYQRTYLEGGGSVERLAGSFVWHPGHDHFHFEGYANYVLSAPGLTSRTAQKTSFCVLDTNRVDHRLPGAPKRAAYTTCGADVQGMSVGWGDAYRYYLEGQQIDVTGLPSGVYTLKVDIDPWNRLQELEEQADNSITVNVNIDFSARTVSVVGNTDGGRPGNRPR